MQRPHIAGDPPRCPVRPPALPNRPVLLVEPEPVPSRAALEAAVEGRAPVRIATSLQDGLARLRAEPCHAVLLSLDFPGADLELAGRLVESGLYQTRSETNAKILC